MSWDEARQQMLLEPTITNLNTGSFGPLPRVVFDEATALRRRLAAAPMDFFVRQMPPLLWQARVALARFVGARPERIVFTENVTTAINLVSQSISLASPGEILISDHEYRAMHWCWERTAQRLGLTLRTFALPVSAEDPEAIVASLRRELSPRTRLVFFSHVLSPTGLVLPAKEMVAAAKKQGAIVVIDGAHAPAMLPLHLEDIDADFYGSNCHKWLLAPSGAGFLHIGRGREDALQPLQVSWGWQRAAGPQDQPDEFGSTPRTRFLEFEGTRDVCPWLAIPAAIAFQTALGFEAINQRNRELAAHVRQRFAAMPELTPWTPANPSLSGFLTAFRLPPGIDPVRLRQALWARRIEINVIDRPDHTLFRVSTHFYNTHEEIDRLAEALPAMLRESRLA